MTPWLRAAYDREAPRYDDRFEAQQAPKIHRLDGLLPSAPGLTLDLGAGTGLLHRLTGRAVLQIDGSVGMLAQARGPRVLADLERLPLPTGVAAAAFCVTALIGPASPLPALAEALRVLTPGGWLALSVSRHEDPEPVARTLADLGFHILQHLDMLDDVGWIARRP
ncbi:MAG: class I SAM-dependent methyltransferase [Myxococcales bacterium]|nr:class I SAM-dependent methyltransferase [Myxococcales bacterium]MCB9521902.1 class I SAM-dependent methyltransferase [Myxococcales bacterium]